MTPLQSNRNCDLDNKGYEEERLIYQESDFQIPQAIAQHYEVWNEPTIDSRQRQLANIAAAI